VVSDDDVVLVSKDTVIAELWSTSIIREESSYNTTSSNLLPTSTIFTSNSVALRKITIKI
jgi:hypothetical protein